MVVEGCCAKRRRAQAFGVGPELTDEGVSSETPPLIRRRHGDGGSWFSLVSALMSLLQTLSLFKTLKMMRLGSSMLF